MEIQRNKKLRRRAAFMLILHRIRIPGLTLLGVIVIGLVVIPALLRSSVSKSAKQADIPVSGVAIPTPGNDMPVFEEPPAPSPVQAPPPQDNPQYASLCFDDKDAAVIPLQERLMELCYMDSDEPTDYFGPATESALKRFQRVHYMTQTGVADSLTQSILFSDKAKIYVLQQGDNGDDVLMMQERLHELGYYSDKTNGYFGTATSRALTSFKTKNKLDLDSVAGQSTRDLLYSPKAKPKVDPTPTPKPKPSPTPKATLKPGSTPPASSKPSGGSGITGECSPSGLISVAKAQLNKPYVWSDKGPDSFDCSGLVYYCLRGIGINVGRCNAEGFSQSSLWQEVSGVNNLKAGDLIFFRSDGSARISHTGIWLGGNQYLHASSTAGKVIISGWSGWSDRNFVLGRRVF
ncbi:MAG: peptidoglycan-binding protein [Clostridia bacterium]